MLDRVEHRYADNGDVRLHYAIAGPADAPLVVFIHGFPDFWYSWREQMAALEDRFRVAALDMRGYNLSDQPKGVENYAMPLLVSDVAAVNRGRIRRVRDRRRPRLGRRRGLERRDDSS